MWIGGTGSPPVGEGTQRTAGPPRASIRTSETTAFRIRAAVRPRLGHPQEGPADVAHGGRPRATERQGSGTRGGVSIHGGGDMANVLRCEDFMVGCPYVVHGATREEVSRQAAEHLAADHHIQELTPGLATTVKRNIRTAA